MVNKSINISSRDNKSHTPSFWSLFLLLLLFAGGNHAYALDCSKATASPNLLWPPNHQMAKIQITGLGDANIAVQCISQDEPLNDSGDGNTEFDASGSGSPYAYVRQERAGGGNGRVYHIDFKATNDLNEQCFGSVQVGVPPSKKKGVTDDGALYYSVEDTSLCGTDVSNLPPVIQTQAVPTVYLGNTYKYDVDATDPEGSALSYALIDAPTQMQINRDSGLVTWVPSESQVGEHTVQLIVIDDQDASVTQEFTVNVLPPLNSAPVITSTPITQATVGIAYTYQVLANDLDNDPLSFQLNMAPERMTMTEKGLVQWIATNDDVTQHTVSISVNDGQGGVAYQSFTLAVQKANSDPIISSEPVPQAWVNQPYQYQVIATDTDGDALSYALSLYPQGMTLTEKGLIDWTPAMTDEGDHQVEVQVSDNRGGLVIQNYVLTATIPNHNPVIISEPITKGITTLVYSYQLMAEDEDGDALIYSLMDAPDTMLMDESGLITWLPQIGDEGSYAISVLVSDSREGSSIQTYTLSIEPRANTAPIITSTPITSAIIGQNYSYTLTIQDSENDPALLALNNAPQGMVLDEETHTVMWLPSPADAGSHEVLLTVQDNFGDSTTQAFTLSASFPNHPPMITSTALTTGQEGQLYQYQIAATDIDGDQLFFNLRNGPTNASINTNTGLLTWLPGFDDAGTYSFTVEVSDNQALSTQEFTVDIANSNRAPVAESQILNMLEDASIAINLSGSDKDGDSLTYLLKSQPQNGTLIGAAPNLTYVPAPNYVGSDSFSFFVNDSKLNSNTASVNITINSANDKPEIISVPQGLTLRQGETFLYQVVARDEDSDELTYSITSSLPDISIDQTGLVSASTETVEIGYYNVSIRVTDSENEYDSQNITLGVISNSNNELVIVSTPGESASATSGYAYQVETNYTPSQYSIELLEGPANATLSGIKVLWPGDNQNTTEKDQKIASCANIDEFVIGSYGSSSLYVESLFRPDRFDKLYKQISPTLADTTNIDNQLALGTQARILTGQQWGFADTSSYTTSPPYWTGVLTRLVVRGPEGADLGFSNSNATYTYPYYGTGLQERALAFHNDTWHSRLSHNLCESSNNFGVISGLANGNWEECKVANWGKYGVITAMPQARFWRSDLVITRANVTLAQTVNFELRNRGLVPYNAFSVNVYEKIDGVFQPIASLPVEEADSYTTQAFSINVGHAIQNDIRIAIEYSNPEEFECDATNNVADLKYFKVKALSNTGLVATQSFWVSTSNDQLEVPNELPHTVYGGAKYVYRPDVLGGSGGYQYTVIEGPTTASFNAKGELHWPTTNDDVGKHSLSVRIADGAGHFVVKNAEVDVLAYPTNQKPEVLSIPPKDATVGQEYVYQLEIVDADGDDITILSSSGTLDENYRLTWTPTMEAYNWALSRGGYAQMTIEMMDAQGAVNVYSWGVNLHLKGENPSNYPDITPIESSSTLVDRTYQASVVANNPLGDELLYSLTKKPAGMVISSTGVISWTPGETQIGEHNVTVRVSNSEGYDEYSYFVEVLGVLHITSTPPQIAYEAGAYHYSVLTSVPADQYTLSLAPSGMTISESGVISWIPTTSDIGTHNVLITVEDQFGHWTTQSFVLSVYGNNPSTNRAPEFTSVPTTRAIVNVTYTDRVQAIDPEGLPLEYSLVTSPDGMTLSSSGELSWTPSIAQLGANSVSIQVSDGIITTTQSYAVIVAESFTENQAPQITSQPIQQFDVGQMTVDQVVAIDADGDNLLYLLPIAPDGMSIDYAGQISWQPSGQQVGLHSVELNVVDGVGGKASQSYQVFVREPVVNNASFLRLINEPKTEAFVGTNYRFRTSGFSAKGGSVTVVLAAAPDGMTIKSNTPYQGVYELNWLPDEANCQREVTLELSDSFGNTNQVTFTIDVYNAPKKQNRFQCSVDAEFCATR